MLGETSKPKRYDDATLAPLFAVFDCLHARVVENLALATRGGCPAGVSCSSSASSREQDLLHEMFARVHQPISHFINNILTGRDPGGASSIRAPKDATSKLSGFLGRVWQRLHWDWRIRIILCMCVFVCVH